MSSLGVLERLKQRLSQAFTPTFLEVLDDSAKHAGHHGARQGGGHYSVEIHSAQFAGKSLLGQHQLVYDSVSDLLKTEIHALKLKTKAT